MSDNESTREQKKLFFLGIIFAIGIGVLGNLCITSGFETARILKLNENLWYSQLVPCIPVGSFVLLVITGWLAWNEYRKI